MVKYFFKKILLAIIFWPTSRNFHRLCSFFTPHQSVRRRWSVSRSSALLSSTSSKPIWPIHVEKRSLQSRNRRCRVTRTMDHPSTRCRRRNTWKTIGRGCVWRANRWSCGEVCGRLFLCFGGLCYWKAVFKNMFKCRRNLFYIHILALN